MSLKDTYQSRKNLLATNLTAMGVTASGTEGLTTLIDKILNVSSNILYEDSLTSDNNKITFATGVTHTFDSNGLTIYSNSGDKNNTLNITVPLTVRITGQIRFNVSGGFLPSLHNTRCLNDSYANMCLLNLNDNNPWGSRTSASKSTSQNTWYTFNVWYLQGYVFLMIDTNFYMVKSATQTVPQVVFPCNTNSITIKNITVTQI